MMNLNWVFLGLVIATVLCSVGLLHLLIIRIVLKGKLKRVRHRKEKSKARRRAKRNEEKKLEKKLARSLAQCISLLVIVMLFGASTFGLNYYFTKSLSQKDSEEIAKAYYLLAEAETELQEIKEGDNPEKARNNLREVTARLASFGIYRADNRLSLKRQQELNHFYLSLKQLGLNIGNQTTADLQEEDIYTGYLADITKCQDRQKKVFEIFNVNEAALKTNKQVAKT